MDEWIMLLSAPPPPSPSKVSIDEIHTQGASYYSRNPARSDAELKTSMYRRTSPLAYTYTAHARQEKRRLGAPGQPSTIIMDMILGSWPFPVPSRRRRCIIIDLLDSTVLQVPTSPHNHGLESRRLDPLRHVVSQFCARPWSQPTPLEDEGC